ncbi:nickel/cobalt transporter [Enterovirga aerilata]|uniref:Nickel/cobalt efflux system n=1 Tax=Enterovirga aerilata TaxID=2730920 RepID=A0A849I8W9_9HYPH|nr:nickel transporter [Enterovirga sp. DB1703]NNM72520.1 nickel transporter [Enterovirga sp. DB1703]
MSVNSAAAPAAPPVLPRAARRLLVAAVAVAAVAALIGLLGLLVGGDAPAAPPPKNPFGTGIREPAPAATGLGGWILAVQSEFYRSLTGALSAMKRDGAAFWSLAFVGFLYGVFHAAGPGHGKGVISGYILATKRTLLRGVGLSFAAAFVQAAVAIGLVAVMAAVLQASSASINAAASVVEIASFAALLLVGLALLWRKTAGIVAAPEPAHAGHGHHHHLGGHEHHAHAHHHQHGETCGCGHSHGPSAAQVEKLTGWRESAGIVLAAGIRPCSGAIILLVFALSQGLFWAGIAATLAMALGTAITTGALAALAVLAKGVALRLAGGRGEAGARAVAWLEVLAAAFVAVLGGALLLGMWGAAAVAS